MLISEDTVKQVKSEAKIYDVISDYVALRKKGKDYFGKCPFHDEKSASFSVSPKSNLYYCFGCNTGGDAIKFIQDFNSCNFMDAVVVLAQKSGVEIKLLDSEKQAEYDERKSEENKLLEILANAANYYHHQLKQNFNNDGIFRQFLDGRGLENDTVDSFLIGCAADSRDSLYQHLLEHLSKYQDVFLKSGLFKETSTGLVDFFRNRIIIPIRDAQGRVIAFGGRSLGEEKPKYLNSPETILFDKGKTLFGLNVAKDAVKRFKDDKGYLILTEGYFDVIALHQIGFTNAVACLGTAVTDTQIKKLLKLSNTLYLNLDGDKAGIESTRKIIKSLEFEIKNDLIDLKVVSLPEKDASDFVLNNGLKSCEKLVKLLTNSKNWVDWLIDSQMLNADLSNDKSWKSIFKYMVETLQKLDDIDRVRYIQHFSEMLSVNENYTQSDIYNLFLKRLDASDNVNSTIDNVVNINDKKTEKIKYHEQTIFSESIILKIYLHHPEYREFIISQMLIKNIDFCLAVSRELWLEIYGIESVENSEPETLLEKIKFCHVDDNLYQDYLKLSEHDLEIINKPSQVLNLAFNHLEIKSFETLMKTAYGMWKTSGDDKYFTIYQGYFQQFKESSRKAKELEK